MVIRKFRKITFPLNFFGFSESEGRVLNRAKSFKFECFSQNKPKKSHTKLKFSSVVTVQFVAKLIKQNRLKKGWS